MSIIDEISSIERKVRRKLKEHETKHGDRLSFLLNLLNLFMSNPIYPEEFKKLGLKLDLALKKLSEIAIPLGIEDSFIVPPPQKNRRRILNNLSLTYIGGLDTSYRRNPDKFIYPFLYISTASYLTGPELKEPFRRICSAFYFLDEIYDPEKNELERRIQMESYIRENEYRALEELIDEINRNRSEEEAIIIFDESFSPFYLTGAHDELVELYNEFLNRKFNLALKNDVIPLAFFETLSKSFAKYLIIAYYCLKAGLKCEKCSDRTCLTYSIPDKSLISFYLSKLGLNGGYRTQVMKFVSEARQRLAKNEGEEILGFYLSLNEREVVRVEFPSGVLKKRNWGDKLNKIHLALLATVMQGSGYPYVLNKTHELARRRADEMKRRIELMISEIAGKIYPYETFTAKQLAKRRRGV